MTSQLTNTFKRPFPGRQAFTLLFASLITLSVDAYAQTNFGKPYGLPGVPHLPLAESATKPTAPPNANQPRRVVFQGQPALTLRSAWRSQTLVGQKLADEIRSEKDESVGEKKRKELNELLNKEFKKRHAQQAEQIEALQTRLENARTLHEQRSANQEKIIQRRMEDLLGTPAALRWSSSSEPQNLAYSSSTTGPLAGGTWFSPTNLPQPEYPDVKTAEKTATIDRNITTYPQPVLETSGFAPAPATQIQFLEERALDLVRRWDLQQANLRFAEIKLGATNTTFRQGASTSLDLEDAKFLVQKAMTEVKRSKQEREFLEQSIKRSIELAELKLQHAVNELNALQDTTPDVRERHRYKIKATKLELERVKSLMKMIETEFKT